MQPADIANQPTNQPTKQQVYNASFDIAMWIVLISLLILGPALLVVAFYRRRSFFDTNVRRFADASEINEHSSISSAHPPTVSSNRAVPRGPVGGHVAPPQGGLASAHSRTAAASSAPPKSIAKASDDVVVEVDVRAASVSPAVSAMPYQEHYPQVSNDWMADSAMGSSSAASMPRRTPKKKRIEPRESLLSVSSSASKGDFSASRPCTMYVHAWPREGSRSGAIRSLVWPHTYA